MIPADRAPLHGRLKTLGGSKSPRRSAIPVSCQRVLCEFISWRMSGTSAFHAFHSCCFVVQPSESIFHTSPPWRSFGMHPVAQIFQILGNGFPCSFAAFCQLAWQPSTRVFVRLSGTQGSWTFMRHPKSYSTCRHSSAILCFNGPCLQSLQPAGSPLASQR